MEILRLLTAGSVDDGKSTLIGRLFFDSGKITDDQLLAMKKASDKQGSDLLNLAFFTDGLTAERDQGITIDVAYRYFESSKRKFILADAPGHLEYTRNMVTAASQSDAVIILIDVERGVTEQTKRHAWICQWLGIQNFAICINKLDLVGYSEEKYLSIRREMEFFIRDFAPGVSIEFIPISGLLGEGVVRTSAHLSWYQGPTLMEWLNAVPISKPSNNPAVRFSVQMKIQDGYAGKLNNGKIKKEDHLVSPRLKTPNQVDRIEKFGLEVQEVLEGELATLFFKNKSDLVRGDLLTEDHSNIKSSKLWNVELCYLDVTPGANETEYFARINTFETKAVIQTVNEVMNPHDLKWQLFSSDTLLSNQIVRATIQFENEVHADEFGSLPLAGRMILIHGSSFETSAVVLLKNPL